MRSQYPVEKLALALTAILLISPFVALLTGRWIEYWKFITILGEDQAYVVLAAMIFVALSPQLGYFMLLSLLTSVWVNVCLKNTLAMPRPPPEQWIVKVEGYGFPSGHAQASAAFWSSASLYLRNASVTLLGAVLVALISASRLVLHVHYPVDVIGGALIGLLVAAASYKMTKLVLRTDRRRASLSMLLYSLLVALLYAVQRDPTIIRAAGVLTGASMYPLLQDRIRPAPRVAWRLVLLTLALTVALLLTQLAKMAPLAVQFVLYLITAVVIILTPLAGRRKL